MGSKPSKTPVGQLVDDAYVLIVKHLKTLLIENIAIYERDSKLKKMVIYHKLENMQAIVDVEYTMRDIFPFSDAVTGMTGDITLGSLIKSLFISEINDWINPMPYINFITDDTKRTHTANKLANAFIKHLFNGNNVVFGSTNLVIDKKELVDFINDLKSAHSVSYKCTLLRKLIISKLDTFELSSCMNEGASIEPSAPSNPIDKPVYGMKRDPIEPSAPSNPIYGNTEEGSQPSN